MHQKFIGDRPVETIQGKTVILIDDGIATGNTILGTIRLIRQGKPGKIVVGVPVASKDALKKISKEVDEVVTILVPEKFYGVGAFYENFNEVDDEEVLYYLEKSDKF